MSLKEIRLRTCCAHQARLCAKRSTCPTTHLSDEARGEKKRGERGLSSGTNAPTCLSPQQPIQPRRAGALRRHDVVPNEIPDPSQRHSHSYASAQLASSPVLDWTQFQWELDGAVNLQKELGLSFLNRVTTEGEKGLQQPPSNPAYLTLKNDPVFSQTKQTGLDLIVYQGFPQLPLSTSGLWFHLSPPLMLFLRKKYLCPAGPSPTVLKPVSFRIL